MSLPTSLLWHAVHAPGLATVAVMGMAKNTGKTVVLNHLLEQAAAAGVAAGLTSIGRDGEARDLVFDLPKPPVVVHAGQWVATARGTLARAGARHRIVAATGITSVMGEIVLLRVLERGTLEVAGATHGAQQRVVAARLRDCGALQVFVDGALGRSQHASPGLADGVVLATGAALGGVIADVLRRTHERLALLTLEAADAATQARCAALFERGGVAGWDADGVQRFSAEGATLNAAPRLREAPRGITTVACSGAVGRSLCQAFATLAERQAGLTVVVADGTRLFVDAADLAALRARGVRVLAQRPIRVAAITLNPTTPRGAPFDPGRFLAQARSAWPERVVVDVLQATAPEPFACSGTTHDPVAT